MGVVMSANIVLKRIKLYYNVNEQAYLDSLTGKTFSSKKVSFKRVSNGKIGWIMQISDGSGKFVFARHGIHIRFDAVTIRKTKSNKYYCYIESTMIPSKIDFGWDMMSAHTNSWNYISQENKDMYIKLKKLGHLEIRLEKEKRNLERKVTNSNNYLKQVKKLRKIKKQIKKERELVKGYLSD